MLTTELAPILLIEDDPHMRSLVASLLADQGSRLVMARSGREGLAKLQASAEHMVVVSSGVLRDTSLADFLRAVVHDGGLARRHAFVFVTPERLDPALLGEWQSQVPVFAVQEPYSASELHELVARGQQCVALSRALLGASAAAPHALPQTRQPAHSRARKSLSIVQRSAPPGAEQPSAEAGSTAGVMVVGGEAGTRTCIAHLLAREPYAVSDTGDADTAITWLRACAGPVSVIVNTTAKQQYVGFLRAVSEEAQLIRHSYLLMVPTGHWLSADQRELLGMLNAPVVMKPFAPGAFRQSFHAFVGAALGAGMPG